MALLDQKALSIPEILPHYPIYIALLPKEAQDVIGKTHEATRPAVYMLTNEGFIFNHEVDVLEAGPTLEAPTKSIRTIKNSRLIHIETTSDLLTDGEDFILSNERLDFRACYGKLHIINKDQGIINQDVAQALRVKPGEMIRYITLH
jgi:arginine N-succinyltransferase